MKKLIAVLAALSISTFAATSLYAEEAAGKSDDAEAVCRQAAAEQGVSEDALDSYVAECVAKAGEEQPAEEQPAEEPQENAG